MNNWIQTYTGKKFFPTASTPDSVDILDIAHALSMKCRFGGMCQEYYSVAEHCVRVAQIVKKESKLLALLHDAAEAYLADIASPIKCDLAFWDHNQEPITHVDYNAVTWKVATLARDKLGFHTFSEREDILLSTILMGLDIKVHLFGHLVPPDVKQADLIMLATEARDLMGTPPESWSLNVPVLPAKIRPMSQKEAKVAFLKMYKSLTRTKKAKVNVYEDLKLDGAEGMIGPSNADIST